MTQSQIIWMNAPMKDERDSPNFLSIAVNKVSFANIFRTSFQSTLYLVQSVQLENTLNLRTYHVLEARTRNGILVEKASATS